MEKHVWVHYTFPCQVWGLASVSCHQAPWIEYINPITQMVFFFNNCELDTGCVSEKNPVRCTFIYHPCWLIFPALWHNTLLIWTLIWISPNMFKLVDLCFLVDVTWIHGYMILKICFSSHKVNQQEKVSDSESSIPTPTEHSSTFHRGVSWQKTSWADSM